MKLPVDYTKITQPGRRLVREAYIEKQDGKCAFCHCKLKKEPSVEVKSKEDQINWDLFPGGIHFLDHPIHLDHNHRTGMTRGAVHALCNAFMWQFHGE
jgi:hypothetical protein